MTALVKVVFTRIIVSNASCALLLEL